MDESVNQLNDGLDNLMFSYYKPYWFLLKIKFFSCESFTVKPSFKMKDFKDLNLRIFFLVMKACQRPGNTF